MEIRVEDKSSFEKILTLGFDAEEIASKYEDLVKKYLPKMQVPGFRAGKAPKGIIRARFGEALMDEVLQEILQEDLTKAIDEELKDPLGLKDFSKEPPKFDEPFEVTAVIEVKPIIESVEYKGLKVEKPIYVSSDEDIDQTIENIRSRSATLEEVDESADMGDYLVVKLNDELKYLPLQDDIPDETLKKLLGLKKDDKLEDSFTFPENYIDRTIAGKTIEGELVVMQVKSKVLPELNLEFMKTIFPDIEKEEDFREMVAKNMSTELDSQTKKQLESNLVVALYEANKFDVPPIAVDNELIERFALRYGIPKDQITDKQLEAIREMHGKGLAESIGARWLLEKIAQDENIEATEEEISAKIEEHAQAAQMDVEDVRKILEEKDEYKSISSDILIEKAMKLVFDNAEIVEKDIKLGEDAKESDSDD